MFLKVIRFAAIALCVFLALDFAFELINAADTTLNVLGFLIIAVLIAVTCEFKCIVKIERDENNNQEN